MGKSRGRFGFGATHRGSSFGIGAGGIGIGTFTRFRRGSLAFAVGKNGFALSGPKGGSGECPCMLLSTAFLIRGSFMLTAGGAPLAARLSEGEEYVGEISIRSSWNRFTSSLLRYKGGDCDRGVRSILLLFRPEKFRYELFTGCGKAPNGSCSASQRAP